MAIYLAAVLIPPKCSAVDEEKYKAYGVNAWCWDLARINFMKKAHIYYYRIMLHWETVEPNKNEYHYESAQWRGADYEFDAWNFKAAYNAAVNSKKIRISLCIYDSPGWARKDPAKTLSLDTKEYIEFVLKSIKYYEDIVPGIVEAVEVQNEEPTGRWNDTPPAHGTDERDASQNYAEILKQTYSAVKAYNPNILVVMDGIWAGAYHHLDDLYQMGCKGYFDRINFHYYTGQDIGASFGERIMPNSITSEHFPTVLGYLKHIADINNDPGMKIWLTEFGWRLPEKEKSKNIVYILDNCRKTGYVERTNYYEFAPYPDDSIALVDNITLADNPKDNRDEFGWVGNYAPKKSYYEYKKYAEKYPLWDRKEYVDYIPKASGNAGIANAGFETGKEGWTGNFTIDNSEKHGGSYSAKVNSTGTLTCGLFGVEEKKLYEVCFWVKISAQKPDNILCLPNITYYNEFHEVIKGEVSNNWGIVDTRKYPGGWRRIIIPAVPPRETALCEIKFDIKGEGMTFIDDVSMNSLDLSYLNAGLVKPKK